MNLSAQVTNPDPVNGPNFLMRPFVSPTNFTTGGIMLQPGSALDHVEFLPGGGGASRPLPFSGVGQLNGWLQLPGAAHPRVRRQLGLRSGHAGGPRRPLCSLRPHDQRPQHLFRRNAAGRHAAAKPLANGRAALGRGRPDCTSTILSSPRRLNRQMQAESRQFVGFGIFTPNLPGNPFEDGQLIAKNRYGQVTGGFTHNLSDKFLAGNWALDSYVQYAQNRQETVDPGGMRTDRLFLSMDAVTNPANGQPVCRVTLFNPGIFDSCVPINLIGGTASVTPAAANYVIDNGKIARGRVTEEDAEVSIRGDLTKGSGGVLGSISAAAGVSWREEQLGVRTVDPCDEFPCTIEGQLMSDLGLAVPRFARDYRVSQSHDRRAAVRRPGSPVRALGLRRRREFEHRAVHEPAHRRGRLHGARGVRRVRHSAAEGRQVESRRSDPRRLVHAAAATRSRGRAASRSKSHRGSGCGPRNPRTFARRRCGNASSPNAAA